LEKLLEEEYNEEEIGELEEVKVIFVSWFQLIGVCRIWWVVVQWIMMNHCLTM
jgi:hypothetical protein